MTTLRPSRPHRELPDCGASPTGRFEVADRDDIRIGRQACGSDHSAIVGHSACQPPAARSCSCGIAVRIVATSPGVRSRRDSRHRANWILLVRHRGRTAAPLLFECLADFCLREHREIATNLAERPTEMPNADATSAMRSRWVCHGIAGTVSPNSFAIASATAEPASPSEASVPDAPPSWSTCDRSAGSRTRARQRPIMSSQPAAFRPNVVGLPC